MNETASDKKQPADTKLTRIPVKHLYFTEDTVTIQNWGSQFSSMSNLKTEPQPSGKDQAFRQHVTAVFIPAWHVFELTFHQTPDGTTQSYTLMADRVKGYIPS